MAISIKLLLNTKSIATTLVFRPHTPPNQAPMFALIMLARTRDDGSGLSGSCKKCPTIAYLLPVCCKFKTYI